MFCGLVKIPFDLNVPNSPRQFNKNAAMPLKFPSLGGLLASESQTPRSCDDTSICSAPSFCSGGEPPRFDLEHSVIRLHGRHRLKAAWKVLTRIEDR